MNPKNLFKKEEGERAVSPVIGVILMVAITVILAAVIGAFVIGIGEDQEVQPTASFSFDFSSPESGTSDAEVVISHSQGDSISSPDSAYISIDGDRAEWDDSSESFETPTDDDEMRYTLDPGAYDVSAGSQVTVSKTDANTVGNYEWDGESISVIWESESGDSSATLSDTTAPN